MFLNNQQKRLKRILIVDDEGSFLHLFEENFFKQVYTRKYKFTYCKNVPTALKQIKNNRPDLILLDIQMSPMRGFDLLNLLKRFRVKIPTIIISAYGDEENRSQAMKLRAYDFFQKPVDFKKLEKSIDDVLEIVREEEELESNYSPFPEDKKNQLVKPPSYIYVSKLIQQLDPKQQLKLVYRLVEETFSFEQIETLICDLPSLLEIANEEHRELRALEQDDLRRKKKGLIPLRLILASDIEVKKRSYTKKKTGEISYYYFIFLRYMDKDNKMKRRVISTKDWQDLKTKNTVLRKIASKEFTKIEYEILQKAIQKLEQKLEQKQVKETSTQENPSPVPPQPPKPLPEPQKKKNKKKTFRLF